MTTALSAKKYIFDLITELYESDDSVWVYYGPNAQFQGFVCIEVLNITWDSTENVGLGRADGNRREQYSIAVGIRVQQKDEELHQADLATWTIYEAIDDAINAEPSLGGLINGGARCTPELLASAYVGAANYSVQTFNVDCMHSLF